MEPSLCFRENLHPYEEAAGGAQRGRSPPPQPGEPCGAWLSFKRGTSNTEDPLMSRLARTIAAAAALAFGLGFLSPAPARADGAASTRNIILGGAAAAAGALIIINHNKQVHAKYAEYDRQQAQLQAENSNMQAAYSSERSAYL